MYKLEYNLWPLARVLTIALLVYAAAEIAMAVHSGVLVWYFNQLSAADADIMYLSGLTEAIDDWGVAVGLFYLASLGVCIVLSCFWIFRAAKNAETLVPWKKSIGPKMSVIWNFIPVFNLWMPYRAMREIWNATFAPFDPIDRQTPMFFKLWWGSWILVGVIGKIITRTGLSDDIDVMTVTEILAIVSTPFSIMAAILFAMIVRQVSRQQPFAAQSLTLNEETSNDQV